MQLPRGTFLSIKRSTKVGDLLIDLQELKFTGVCTISSKTGNGTIVLKSGKRILAEFRNTSGDAAWDDLLKISGEKVDASLSTLTDAQIQLSLEFNKSCLIVKGAKAEIPPLADIPPPPPRPKAHSPAGPQKQSLPFPGIIQKKPGILAVPPAHKPVQPVTSQQPPKIISDSQLRTAAKIAEGSLKTPVFIQSQDERKSGDPLSIEPEADSSSFEADIDTFETMDVDAIQDKIRGECRHLIKELDLEHLTGDETGKVKR
jgi:hypothetical protein